MGKKYNWDQFKCKSDIVYRNLLNGESADLENHNIITAADKELGFYFNIASFFWGFQYGKGCALDVGCGSGFLTNELRKFNYKAVGFDLSQDAVSLAKSLYSKCDFYCYDADNLDSRMLEKRFSLVIMREIHPLSRVNDFVMQSKLISSYLKMLLPGGLLIISHARRGGGMSFGSVDFKKLKNFCESEGCEFKGPYFYFLFKHLGLAPSSRILLNLISWAAKCTAIFFNQRWLECVLIYKNKNPTEI